MDAVEVKPKPTKQPVVYVDAPLYETPPPPKVKKAPARTSPAVSVIQPYENPIIPKIITPRTSPSAVAAVDGGGTWHSPNIESTKIVAPKFRDDFYIVDEGDTTTVPEDSVFQQFLDAGGQKDSPETNLPHLEITPHVWNPQTPKEEPSTTQSTPTFQPTDIEQKTVTDLGTEFGPTSEGGDYLFNVPNLIIPDKEGNSIMADIGKAVVGNPKEVDDPSVSTWGERHPTITMDMARKEGETRRDALAGVIVPEGEPTGVFLTDDILMHAAISTGKQLIGKDSWLMNLGVNTEQPEVTTEDKGFWWNFRNQPTAGKEAADAAKENANNNNNDPLNILSGDTIPRLNTTRTGWRGKEQEDVSF